MSILNPEVHHVNIEKLNLGSVLTASFVKRESGLIVVFADEDCSLAIRDKSTCDPTL